MAGSRIYALGIDASTQSMTGTVMDAETGSVAATVSVSYRDDPRTAGFGIEHDSFLIPPREPGEAEQPPRMFAAALDALFDDLKKSGAPLDKVMAVNASGQQHGHVYFSSAAGGAFASLKKAESAAATLDSLTRDSYAYGGAPIWKTANTNAEREEIAARAGGMERVVRTTGSALPHRFSANAIRLVGKRYPAAYDKTWRVAQISTLVSALLSGDAGIPLDFGNACGVALMDYASRRWDSDLTAAAGSGLPGGPSSFALKLPPLCHPLAPCGTVAAYFVAKYGMSPGCAVLPGSGDNPQTKNAAEGDFLSLGTSYVYMMDTGGGGVDLSGASNAMYDGLGRPFIFACRTNGALSWERVRTLYGKDPKDFASSDAALASVAPGSAVRFWHCDAESFPLSGRTDAPVRGDSLPVSFETDYSGIVDSSLGLLYSYSAGIGSGASDTPMYASGGPTASAEVMRRVAAIWNRKVMAVGQAGAAYGAALAAAVSLVPESGRAERAKAIRALFAGNAKTHVPDPALVRAYHGDGGYLGKLTAFFEKSRK